MLSLAFDTASTPLCVAVSDGDKPLAQIQTNKARNHSVTLMPAIDQVLKLAQVELADIDCFIVTRGPGSYTGVRIAVTTAKTLAWTLNKPLYALSSLRALLVPWRQAEADVNLVPVIDARRDHYFAGLYQVQDQLIQPVAPDAYRATAEICQQLIQHEAKKAVIIGSLTKTQKETFVQQCPSNLALTFATAPLALPMASGFATLLTEADRIQNLDAFVPTYLRETQAESQWQQQHPHATGQTYVEQV